MTTSNIKIARVEISTRAIFMIGCVSVDYNFLAIEYVDAFGQTCKCYRTLDIAAHGNTCDRVYRYSRRLQRGGCGNAVGYCAAVEHLVFLAACLAGDAWTVGIERCLLSGITI